MTCDRFAKLLANHSVPTYEYSFEYRGQYSIVNLQGEQVRGGDFLNKMSNVILSGVWFQQKFAIFSRRNFFDSLVILVLIQVDMGVAHGDDLQYIFNGIWGEELQMSPSDTKFTRNIFTPLLANFAKTSVPTPAMNQHINTPWPPLSPASSNVYRIDSKLSVMKDYLEDRLRFWSETVPGIFMKKEKKGAKKEEL